MLCSTRILAYALTVFYLHDISHALTTGSYSDLYINNADVAPDGFDRSAVVASKLPSGGSVTGPLIRGYKGSVFEINVVNQLTDSSMLKSTSIHWHGFFQKKTAWADGPAFVTQCPIAPGDSFLYQFKVPDQAGTFWYHSHLSTQYCDGLRGVFVVKDWDDPHRFRYDVDDENTIITLADWYHTVAPQAGPLASPDSTLINGKGRYFGGPAAPLAVVHVAWGLRYRIRLVAMSCDPSYTFSIDRHSLEIIEVDGVNTNPHVVDSIEIFAGQRYSFVLKANRRIGNYWIRANPNIGTKGFAGGLNSAILRYIGASHREPNSVSSVSNPLRETDLSPFSDAGAPGIHAPGAADVNINLAFSFDFQKYEFLVNGRAYHPPTTPVLLQVISGAAAAKDLLDPSSLYHLPPNKVIEISMPGLSIGGPHPFHLHGHTFDVVRSAGSPNYNFANPVRRDVVSTGVRGDNVTIRFVTDNAGPWFLHCHIDWHIEQGLAVVFAEDTDSFAKDESPPSWKDLCPKYATLSDHDKGGWL
ncbi:hypothetical protein HGRIS_013939 [Hohenbuehelia grisea]|uniref:Laccase n=1 Tax=Hohenbuehelia grisea TaxID=104357 RepID=A0ABR3JTI4_9AGAR